MGMIVGGFVREGAEGTEWGAVAIETDREH